MHIKVNTVKITFFSYGFDIPHPIDFHKIITLPTLLDLAAMKAFALGKRAKWKDYADLYFLFERLDPKDIEFRAKQLFGEFFSEKLFRQQLCYFQDIDYTEAIEYQDHEISKQRIKERLTEIALTPF